MLTPEQYQEYCAKERSEYEQYLRFSLVRAIQKGDANALIWPEDKQRTETLQSYFDQYSFGFEDLQAALDCYNCNKEDYNSHSLVVHVWFEHLVEKLMELYDKEN